MLSVVLVVAPPCGNAHPSVSGAHATAVEYEEDGDAVQSPFRAVDSGHPGKR